MLVKNPHSIPARDSGRRPTAVGPPSVPKRLHQFRVVVVVVGRCPDQTDIEVQLVGNLVERPFALTNQLADLEDTDARSLKTGLSVEHVGRLENLDH